MKSKKLVLKNGMEFIGQGFGCDKVAEVIFNTSMIGYQDILKDPSYTGKIVCMTYPLIGNHGASDDDFGSRDFHVEGFIVKDYEFTASNYRYIDSMVEVLEANEIPFICDIDTRMLAKVIRDQGSMLGVITDTETPIEEALKKIDEYTPNKVLIKKLTSRRSIVIKADKPKYEVVCIDLGIKNNIVENLVERNCNVVILPYDVDSEKVMSYKPNGLFISNGPSSFEECEKVIQVIKDLKGKLPIAGIGLGHLLMAKASGAVIEKMKFGHHGANQSVRNLKTNKIDITCQNHDYVVNSESLKDTDLKPTHINITDNTIEGLSSDKMFISLQYNPEEAQGFKANIKLYDELLTLMKANRGAK